MCGGGGGDSGKDALRYQKRQDAERKARIAEGEAQLEQLFAPLEGKVRQSTSPLGDMTEDQLSARLDEILAPYTQRMNAVPARGWFKRPGGVAGLMEGISPGSVFPDIFGQLQELGFDEKQAGLRNKDALLREFRMGAGSEWVDGATPIWDQHKQAYLDFANPQLDRQFTNAANQLTYALSRAGQTGGSVAVDRREDLETDRGQQQLNIAQTAQDYGNKARSDVSQQKQSLYQMLSNTANPGATSQAARSALSSISSQPALSPLGTLFQNATAGLAGAVPAYRQGQAAGEVNNIIYGRDPDRGSARVIR